MSYLYYRLFIKRGENSMFMLDVEEGADHGLKLIVGVERANGIVREVRDEICALALNEFLLFLWRRFNNAAVEVARGDGDVCAGGFEVAHGPLVIRRDKDGLHLGVLADFTADKVQGFGCGHGVKDVVECVVLRLFGGLDVFEEFFLVDGLDEGVKVNKNEIFVGYEFLCEFGAFGERRNADHILLFGLRGLIGSGGAPEPTRFLRSFGFNRAVLSKRFPMSGHYIIPVKINASEEHLRELNIFECFAVNKASSIVRFSYLDEFVVTEDFFRDLVCCECFNGHTISVHKTC